MDDIQDIRRANLALWLQTHSAPPREKSLFSQLKGGGSFGERVARRLEKQYGMGVGFLDQRGDASSIEKTPQPLSGAAKMLIEWVERIDELGDPARKMFTQMASILEVAQSLKDAHNPIAGPLDEDELSRAEKHLSGVAGTERPGAKSHATRKRARR